MAAHELSNTIVRIQLRDNQFRLLLSVQILDWLSSVKSETSGVGGDFDLAGIPERLSEAKRLLLEQTVLRADGHALELKVLNFPSVGAVTETLTRFSEFRSRGELIPHGFAWLAIEVEGLFTATTSPPSEITAQFPLSLGELSISFEEPQLRLVRPGEQSHFSIGGKQSLEGPAKPSTKIERTLFAVGCLCLLSLVFIQHKKIRMFQKEVKLRS